MIQLEICRLGLFGCGPKVASCVNMDEGLLANFLEVTSVASISLSLLDTLHV